MPHYKIVYLGQLSLSSLLGRWIGVPFAGTSVCCRSHHSNLWSHVLTLATFRHLTPAHCAWLLIQFVRPSDVSGCWYDVFQN